MLFYILPTSTNSFVPSINDTLLDHLYYARRSNLLTANITLQSTLTANGV